MGKISRGWELTKMTLRVVRKDKEILIFPILSGVITMLILASFVAGMFLGVGPEDFSEDTFSTTFYLFFIAFYFISYFLAIYFSACVIGCAMIRMDGGNPTVSDGFRTANENIGRILVWAIIAATVGMVIRAVQQRAGVLGKLIMGAIGVAWTIVTYFVVPVLVFEKVGPWAAVKRSASVLKHTWGETLVGNLGLGIIFGLIGLLGLLAIAVGAVAGGLSGVMVGVIIAVVLWAILSIIYSAAQSVLVTALYRYATTGKVSEEFEGVSFASPFAA